MSDRFKVGDRVRLDPEGPGVVSYVFRSGTPKVRYGVVLDSPPDDDDSGEDPSTPYEVVERDLSPE